MPATAELARDGPLLTSAAPTDRVTPVIARRSASSPHASAMTFAQSYQARHGGTNAQFVRAVLSTTLHAPHRWIAPVLLTTCPHWFAADFELIRYCGQLTKRRSIEAELGGYMADSRNHQFWRRKLRLRISTHRLRRLFRSVMQTAGDR